MKNLLLLLVRLNCKPKKSQATSLFCSNRIDLSPASFRERLVPEPLRTSKSHKTKLSVKTNKDEAHRPKHIRHSLLPTNDFFPASAQCTTKHSEFPIH